MKNIEEINRSNLNKIISERKHPDFFPGDIVKVGVRITEGKRDRIQYFEGVCIAKKSRDINSSFTVRKISFGEGVERTFALYSPIVNSIKVIRSGKVRRAKLYYLRDRTGKSARITEKIKKKIGIDIDVKAEPSSEEKLEINKSGKNLSLFSKYVFLGAGGTTINLLQKSEIPEAKDYGGFPVSGKWLICDNSELAENEKEKRIKVKKIYLDIIMIYFNNI